MTSTPHPVPLLAAGAVLLLALAGPLPRAAFAGDAPAAAPAPDGPRWVLQLGTGTAWQARSRLRVEQEGEEPLDFTARYATRPFTSGAPYYSLRLGRWRTGAAWELETHHHLVTLVDGPPEIESFSATHGYNLNTVNRAVEAGGFIWRAGLGVVVTHPESVVRGRAFDGNGPQGAVHLSQGFYLSGVCAQAGVERRVPLGAGFALALEAKGTSAWARVPVATGWATVPNYAAHAVLGLAYAFP